MPRVVIFPHSRVLPVTVNRHAESVVSRHNVLNVPRTFAYVLRVRHYPGLTPDLRKAHTSAVRTPKTLSNLDHLGSLRQ